jgi:hypothetical protein
VVAILGLHPQAAAAKQPAGKGRSADPVDPLDRRGCTATLLDGGLALVAGGLGSAPLSASQILDPETGLWYDAAPMIVPRHRHAAVPLSEGRVLVMGGMSSQALASAEIYDPRADGWELVAPMNGPRWDHAATQLADHDALVTGGFFETALSSVEIYDARQDRWTLL